MKKKTTAKWFVYIDSKDSGPYTKIELQAMLDSGKINFRSHIYSKDQKYWKPLEECIDSIGLTYTAKGSVLGDSKIDRPIRARINGQVTVHGVDQLLIGVGVNFSSSGLFIETDRKLFNLGDELEITCKIVGLSSSFRVKAKVMRYNGTRPGSIGFGLSFVDPSPS